MKLYKVKFLGKTKGALGINHEIEKEVELTGHYDYQETWHALYEKGYEMSSIITITIAEVVP